VEELFIHQLASREIIRERLSTVQVPHRQILDMAHDYLDQAFDDAQAALKRQKTREKPRSEERDFGPGD